MSKPFSLLLILLTSLIPGSTIAFGQGLDDGSLYSRYGVGELVSFSSSQAQALGGASTALISPDYINFGNPATWSRQQLVRLAVGAQFDQLYSQDAAGRSEQFLRGNFNALQIGIPLWSQRVGLGLSYEPYSRIHFQVSSPGTLTAEGQDLAYQINYEGSGGLHQARVGLGFKLNSWASFGATTDFLFGISEVSRRTTFQSSDLLETNLTTSTRLFGITSTAGVTFSIEGESSALVIAATGTVPTTLNGTRILTLGESLDLDTLGTSTDGKVKLPFQLSAGASLRYQNRWLISAEIRHAPWSNASSELSFTGFDSNHLRDRTRYSLGLEFTPAATSLQAGYFRRTSYRLGVYRDEMYASPVAGRDVSITAVTGGLGLPTLFYGTRIDLSFEIGTRGSIDNNLIRDRYIGVSATLNIGERWFVKRRLG